MRRVDNRLLRCIDVHPLHRFETNTNPVYRTGAPNKLSDDLVEVADVNGFARWDGDFYIDDRHHRLNAITAFVVVLD